MTLILHDSLALCILSSRPAVYLAVPRPPLETRVDLPLVGLLLLPL